MVTIILSWIYIFIICFLLGVGFCSLGLKICGKGDWDQKIPITLFTVMGIMVSTVSASYISCVTKVGMFANLLLIVLAIGSAIWQKKLIIAYWKKSKPIIFSWEGFFYLCFVLLIAFCTSRGEFHTDTNIYHAQNIRIYEEYGLIKGMGNLQQHFKLKTAANAR